MLRVGVTWLSVDHNGNVVERWVHDGACHTMRRLTAKGITCCSFLLFSSFWFGFSFDDRGIVVLIWVRDEDVVLVLSSMILVLIYYCIHFEFGLGF